KARKDSSDWLQGYCYQMWRSRNNSYRGDGAYGQYILVLPEQDAVIAITSETSNMQGILNLVWQHLLPSFKQGTLPVNVQNNARLAKMLSMLGLPLHQGTFSAMEKSLVNNKITYRLDPMTTSMESISFNFQNNVCNLLLKTGTGSYPIAFGNGNWVQGRTNRVGPYLVAGARNRLAGLSPFRVAGSYRWLDEKTLELKLVYVESPHTETITCKFEDADVLVDIRTIFNRSVRRDVYRMSSLPAKRKEYPIKGVSFSKVTLTDSFWLPRIKTNHTVTIPASFERCESTGRVKNFEMAAARSGKFCTRFPFDDTDIYKTIEGASFSLSLFPDKKLEAYVDTLIIKIGKAQEPDGYLYTARTIDPLHPGPWLGMNRWEKERELSHELYNAGHLYEAAVAHYQATGKKTLLNIAIKNADLVCSVFGPEKLHVAPGHQVVEMGLVKLYEVTGNTKYLQTARFFIDERGRYTGYDPKSKDVWKNGAYWQDHKPVIDQREAVGHAVRAGYLYAGMADVAALMGDKQYIQAIDSIWENVVSKKLYVQGSVGAAGDGERFGDNYELPNSTAYNETCAAIANVYWNYRMFLLHGEAKYMDVLERSLYNGLLSGIGLDGKSFFYSNAMQIKNSNTHRDQERTRSGWFECSCCPTNMTRLLPSIPGYMYAQKNDSVYINLFANSTTKLTIGGQPVTIEQQNNYPWEGTLNFKITPTVSASFPLLIRIPGWSQNDVVPSDLYKFTTTSSAKPEVFLNGNPVHAPFYHMDKGYLVIPTKGWSKSGDVVTVKLPMEVKRIVANQKIGEDRGKVALQRGPLVYCVEAVDNNGRAANIVLPGNASFAVENGPAALNGAKALTANLPVVLISENGEQVSTVNRKVTAIPYYAWANRGQGEMIIWFPEKIKELDLLSIAAF
ncbi:MAG TPA: glycoside hydrolase family 127 protein, partial [Chitinophagaceae bacterium]